MSSKVFFTLWNEEGVAGGKEIISPSAKLYVRTRATMTPGLINCGCCLSNKNYLTEIITCFRKRITNPK